MKKAIKYLGFCGLLGIEAVIVLGLSSYIHVACVLLMIPIIFANLWIQEHYIED